MMSLTLQEAKRICLYGASRVVFDVREEKSIQQAVKSLGKRFDLLINNAGVLYDYQTPAIQADIEQIKETFDINTLGPLRVCRAVVPLMNQGGRILNISSGMGAAFRHGLWSDRLPFVKVST